MHTITFLKRVLARDAASCLGIGAALALGAGALAPLLGLERSLLFGAGATLIPVGLFMLWAATRATPPRPAVYLIVAGNMLWVLESLIVLRGAEAITAWGTAFVLVQAAAVAGLAGLEWIGVRRLAPVTSRG